MRHVEPQSPTDFSTTATTNHATGTMSEASERALARANSPHSTSPESALEMATEQEQWRGAVEALLPSTPASAAWPHVADFFSLHRYLPGIDVCERVEAAADKPDAAEAGGDEEEDAAPPPLRPGCVRYCASLAPGEADQAVASWAREALVELDPRARRLVYAVVGSNMGFGRYVASMTVLDDDGAAAAAGGGSGSRLVWAFECDPVDGWSRDGLLAYLGGGVKSMAARIEEEEAAAEGGGAVAA